MIKKIRRKIGGGSIEGFTLVEMLIVVAIIAILIAISIPTVNTALEKSRHAVNDANERAAIGLGNIKYLTDPPSTDTTYDYVVDADTRQGELKTVPGTGSVGVASKCTGAITDASSPDKCDPNGHKNKKLQVKITVSTGKVEAVWGP